MAPSQSHTPSLEEKLGILLLAHRLTLALAESCTGGLVGYRVTAVPGSSRYFRGAVTAYEDRIKAKVLGVRPATIREHGAVSAETAVEMARGARKVFSAAAALSVTGIAGPGGGTKDKPVGLVYAAAVVGRKRKWVVGNFRGSRAVIRRRAADMALELLITLVEEHAE